MSKVVLQYLDGSNPSKAEAAHADTLRGKGWQVKQRNSRMVGDRLETREVTAVTGNVPAGYKDYPSIEVLPYDAEAAKADAEKGQNPADMSVKELKEALDEKGVEYPGNAKKADLVKLLETCNASVLD